MWGSSADRSSRHAAPALAPRCIDRRRPASLAEQHAGRRRRGGCRGFLGALDVDRPGRSGVGAARPAAGDAGPRSSRPAPRWRWRHCCGQAPTRLAASGRWTPALPARGLDGSRGLIAPGRSLVGLDGDALLGEARNRLPSPAGRLGRGRRRRAEPSHDARHARGAARRAHGARRRPEPHARLTLHAELLGLEEIGAPTSPASSSRVSSVNRPTRLRCRPRAVDARRHEGRVAVVAPGAPAGPVLTRLPVRRRASPFAASSSTSSARTERSSR